MSASIIHNSDIMNVLDGADLNSDPEVENVSKRYYANLESKKKYDNPVI